MTRRSALWGMHDARKRAKQLAGRAHRLSDREFSRLVLARDVWCQVQDLGHECGGRSVHAHHVQRRSQGGENTVDNGLGCCAAGHQAIHDNPAAAIAVGYLK